MLALYVYLDLAGLLPAMGIFGKTTAPMDQTSVRQCASPTTTTEAGFQYLLPRAVCNQNTLASPTQIFLPDKQGSVAELHWSTKLVSNIL